MNESELIKQIVQNAKAQNAKAEASSNAAADRQNELLQKRATAGEKWQEFQNEFAIMIEGINSEIMSGGITLTVSKAPPPKRLADHDPTSLGKILVVLKRNTGGPSRESLALNVNKYGSAIVTLNNVRGDFSDIKLNIVDSSIAEFRTAVLLFCSAATHSEN